MTIGERFEQFEDDHGKFDDIAFPRHPRPDICAFMMLHDLDPNPGQHIVCSAEHDQIWLDVDILRLADATDDMIRDIVRCGVRWDSNIECLAMFV